MAGIIEKLAPSTDLAGVEVSTKSNTTPGFEACLASQSLAGDGPDQEGPLATLPSESRQSTDGTAVDLTKTLKPIPTEARSESSQSYIGCSAPYKVTRINDRTRVEARTSWARSSRKSHCTAYR